MSREIAVAVVSWNTRELLERCLTSLEANHRSGLASVWVVDNASTDGSAELVERQFPWVQLIASPENLGFGPAVNLVAARAPEPWIAPANADLELRPGALEALLATGRRGPRTGAVAPRLVEPSGATQHSVHPFPTPSTGLVVNLGLYRLIPGLGDRLCLVGQWNPERARPVSWAHGALLLCRREAFEEVGGFDEGQWMYAEDLDLGWRMREAGWTTQYEPGAVVRHEVSAATTKAFGDERQARHIAAAYDWMRRRQGNAAATTYALENVCGNAARWLALAAGSAVAPERYADRRARTRRDLALHRQALRRRDRAA
jgi:GT2 family glycosyltransferase